MRWTKVARPCPKPPNLPPLPPRYFAPAPAPQTPSSSSNHAGPAPRPPPPAPPAPLPIPRNLVPTPHRPRPRPPPPPQDFIVELQQVLAALPSISSSPSPRLLSRAALEAELHQWRGACTCAYTTFKNLVGVAERERATRLRGQVVRVVAHTMRVLLAVGQVEPARELDRAFFTTLPSPTPAWRGTWSTWQQAVGGANDLPTLPLGEGLGLARGAVNVAWMQALAIRSMKGHPGGVQELVETVEQLKREQRGLDNGGVNSHVVAFAVRKSGDFEERFRESGLRRGEAEKAVRRLLDELREEATKSWKGKGVSKRTSADEKVVLMATVETELEMLEMLDRRGKPLEEALFAQVERDVRDLVGEMDELVSEEALASQEDLHSTTQRSAYYQQVISDRAQTLHIALRLVLFRARLSHLLPPQIREDALRHSLNSSRRIYAALVDLTPLVAADQSTSSFAGLRERQTGALFRTLWASIGTLDVHRAPETRRDKDRPEERDAPTTPLDEDLINASLDLIDLTLAALPPLISTPSTVISSLSSLSSPLAVAISPRFWRRLVLLLTLPSCPSRRAGPLPPATRPAWSTLHRSLTLFLRTTQHDRSLAPSDSSPPPVFLRTSPVIHLVRATLLGGENQSQSDEQTPRERMEYLLRWFEDWERLGMGVRRSVVRSAAELVLAREFSGHARDVWRKEMRQLVREWDGKVPAIQENLPYRAYRLQRKRWHSTSK